MSKLLGQMKQELWHRFGNKDYPSEWDRIVFGSGGKLCQRYWEYFIALEYLDLNADSVVLDIGGGSIVMGGGFFASLISKFVKKVIVIDPMIKDSTSDDPKIEYISQNADYENLKNVFAKNKITHISCVSVFEHMEQSIRKEIIKGVNDFFGGNVFVTTYEFHPHKVFWKHQLNTKDVAELFTEFNNFYTDQFSSSPVLGEDAFYQHFSFGFKDINRGKFITSNYSPKWYPVALKFLRNHI